MADHEFDREVTSAFDQLWAMQPSPLLGTGHNGVQLWAWAGEVADRLHRRFPTLQIVLGCLSYPDRAPEGQADYDAMDRGGPDLDPTQVEVALDGRLVVSSGHDGHHGLAVANHTLDPLVIWTNGRITAHVVDPNTGRVVGISTIAQTLPGVPFRVEPGHAVTVPLLVGTASVDPALGYAVPAGEWNLRATVAVMKDEPATRTDYLTPPLRFEIV